MPLGVLQPEPVAAGPWSPIGQAWVSSMYDTLDSPIALDGSNVSQWDDISGSGQHATQTSAGSRPPYLAADPRANGLPAIGAQSNAGTFGLDTPTLAAGRIYVAISYEDGTDGSFDSFSALLFNGSDSNSQPRIVGASGSARLGDYSNVFASSARTNGAATDTTVLPLPLSILTITADQVHTLPWRMLSRPTVDSRSWPGACVHYGFTTGAESDEDRDRYEGWLAHRFSLTLAAGHSYRDAPP